MSWSTKTMSRSNKNEDKQVLTWTGSVNSNAGATTTSNLAKMFTPRRPMYEPGVELQQLKVWMDIPEDLENAIKDGMENISPECLRRNAEIVLDIFQEMVLKHVLNMQIKDRTYGRIIRGNPSAESESGDSPSTVRLAGIVAKSSLLGKDPWGDEALPTKPSEEEDEETEKSRDAPMYTEVQALLKSVQDTTWQYLTIHVKRILHEEILMSVIDREMAYKADQDKIRSQTPRKRMPWKVYRELILETTMDSSGLYELQVMLALNREVGETAGRWLQRLRIGKSLVEKKNIHLPESLYVNLAIRFITHSEIKTMATSLAQGSDNGTLTMSQARRSIRKLSWNELRVLVESSVHTGGQKYTTGMHKHLGDTRLFTLEQARNFLRIHRTPRSGVLGTNRTRNLNKRTTARCKKCMRAGLVGKVTHHATEDCVDKVRKQNIEKLAKPNSRKRGRDRSAYFSSSKDGVKQPRKTLHKKPPTREEECKDCKAAGRPYRHSSKECKYAPGGPWHKKSREELRVLQRKYYEGKGRATTGRSQSNSAVQENQSRKRTRGEVDQAKRATKTKRPLWDREYSMVTEQDIDSTAEIPESTLTPEKISKHKLDSPRGSRCRIAPEVTATQPGVLKENPGVKLLVNPTGITDFSPLTTNNGPFCTGNGAANPQSAQREDKSDASSSVASIEKNEESAETPAKLAKDIQEATKAACKFCDELSLGFDGDEEYECSESEDESVQDGASPEVHPENPVVVENANQIPDNGSEGSSDRPIDLTSADDEKPALEPSSQCCNMIRGDPSEEEPDPSTDEDPADPQIHITIVPCGPDGKPYGEQHQKYFWYMDQPMWLLMDSLRQDYPIWGDKYQLILPNGRRLGILDDPNTLGFGNGQHVRIRLLLLHLPNVGDGYRLVKDGISRKEEEMAEVHRATVTAALAQFTTVQEAASKSNSSASNTSIEEVVVLEVWSGKCLRMSLRWGRLDPLRRLLGALAAIWMVPKHHLVLLTTAHMLAGEGCVQAVDTPESLSMPRGGTLSTHYIPNKLNTSPAFLPSKTVAWQILETRGVHVWDKTPSGRRYERGGFRGSRKGNILRGLIPIYGKHNQKSTPYYETFNKITRVLRKQYAPLRRNKRKNYIPQRRTGTVTEFTASPLEKDDFSTGRSPPPKSSKKSRTDKRSQRFGSRTNQNRRPRRRKSFGKSSTGFESSPFSEGMLNQMFKSGISEQEISPSQSDLTGKNTQNVSKTKKIPSTRSKSTKLRKNRENPNFSTRAQSDPENEIRRKLVSINIKSDSSTSSTMESDNVTSMSEDSDQTDTSETLIYKIPKDKIQDVAVCRRKRYRPGKFVYTPDMKFPFTQIPLSREKHNNQTDKTHKRAKVGNTTCKGSPRDLSISHVTDTPESVSEDSIGEFSPKKSISEETEKPIISFVSRHIPNKGKRNRNKEKGKPCFSETIPYRLLRTYLKVLDRNGMIKRVQVALDTQSNVSYARLDLGIPRSWKKTESKSVKGIGGYSSTSVPLLTRIVKEGKIVKIDTRSPPSHMFTREDGPGILLSAQHCFLLKIDLNKALASLKHTDTPFLKTKRPKVSIRYRHVCHIAEKLMERYLERTGGSDKEPKQCSIKDVVIAEDFTPEQRKLIKSICNKYQEVFASSPDDIPPPLKDAKPHVFKMIKDCKPLYCKRPNWGPCQRKYLEQWTKKAVEQGLMEPAPESEWASRPVLVGKYRGNTSKKDVPDGIRTCVDFTRVNEFIVKQPPQYTDPFEEIRRASGHTYYFEADGQKQFNSVPLAEESRDITTTWTPLGLMRWKRLIMGTKDASGRAQMEYTSAMTRYLSDEARSHLANFQDDFLGFHNTIPGLLRTFEEFLQMCDKAGITLNPAKIRIGIRKCKFYGFALSKKGMEPSEKNLDPVSKMTIPKNRSEVRSILGVFNQFRHFFSRYDRLVLGIQKLLKKNEPFIWSKECDEGFNHIKEKLLEGKLYLAAPDNTLPLILETDGSDDGWGAILLQSVEGKRRVIKMWSKQWKTLHMRRAPPYYKETKAWMNGLELSRIYADYSPFPVQCITDHIPLTYVKNTSGKGPVSQFLLDNLSSLDYTITYRPGSKLVEADAVSRFPCIGPKVLAADGVIEAFNTLLDALPTNWTNEGKVWVYAQSETDLIQQEVRHWMSTLPKCSPARKVPITDSPTVEKIQNINFSLGLWVPEADKVKTVVNTALNKGTPFACLVPSCLVHLIPENPKHREIIINSKKIVFLQPEMTWITFKIESVTNHQVYSVSASDPTEYTFGDLNDFRGIIKGSPEWDLKEWVPLQQRMIREYPDIYSREKISTRESDGFKLYTPDLEKTLALVPQEYVPELVEWQHKQLCHGGPGKVYSALRKHWHWPDMKKEIRKIVTACAPCQLLKAKRARAHRHFRSKVFCTPRTSWGMDFYGVAESKKGYTNILGAVDLATAVCRLFASKTRSAETLTDSILHGIILRDGCPLHIHSDAAREFISKAMQRLCRLIGCQQTTTLAHHPTGNATIERLWQWIAACLRQMTKEQYQEWEKYVRLMEHVWNTSYHSVLKCTPFEAAHGLKARSAVDSLARGTAHVDTDLMTTDGIEAMRASARAFEQQIHNVRREATSTNAELLRKGPTRSFRVGQEVSFYLPPSEKEAMQMGRKPKHLLQYKGPALVTQKLSSTTYQIEYEGRKYNRCFSELRLYKADRLPLDLPMANPESMQERRLVVGNYVALCDSADLEDDHFHLCKVLSIEDEKALLLNYATFSNNIHNAKFSIMYQERSTLRYTTAKPKRNAREQEVLDKVALEEAEDYVDHYDIKMTKGMKIGKKSIRQLKKLGLKHHVLGQTFP